MRKTWILLGSVALLAFSGCGYHLGGVKPAALAKVSSIRMTAFQNNSFEPAAGSLVSSALAEAIQRDGSFRLGSRGKAQARIEGEVVSVQFIQLRSSYQDTYQSSEFGLVLNVSYRVIDSSTNKVLMSGSETGTSSYFNIGNLQTAKTNALSYAARLVADRIAATITNG